MTKLDARISGLSPVKRKLLEELLREPPPAGGEAPEAALAETPQSAGAAPRMEFSLFFFSDSDHRSSSGANKYQLLLESSRFADRHNFCAVWTPERHFDPFGGLYPNPAVTAAALATITERVELRAGSVVLPLHHPLRVVEEWSVVDNLSGGRVALSFASGWHLDDFVLAPERYEERKAILLREVETIRRLWEGEPWRGRGVLGKEVEICTYPRPVRQTLPVWLTSAGNPETFRAAGELGVNLLTGLTGQRVEELADKIRLYRAARQQAGHDPAAGRVALMLHTFLGDDLATVKELVREPMYAYLKTNLGLHKKQARTRNVNLEGALLEAEDEETLLSFAFERYFKGGALMGTGSSCLRFVGSLAGIGVDEIACLVDFGLEASVVLKGLEPLAELAVACDPRKTE